MLSELASRMTRDVAFGLHVGEHVEQNSYGIVGYSVVSSATLGEALRSLERYLPIWTNVGAFKLEVEPTVAHFQWKYSNGPLPEPRHDVEMTMAAVARFNRLSEGAAWKPREVWFAHPKPKDVSEHARIFRAPVRFDMPVTSLLLDSTLLNLPMRGANSVAHQVITAASRRASRDGSREGQSHAERPQLHSPALVQRRFQSARNFPLLGPQPPHPATKIAARNLPLHRLLVEQARRDLSLCLLLGSHATATEVAYALGFSDPTAFHHAFHRWHGMSPRAYRDAKIR